jgi:hypothetical protein
MFQKVIIGVVLVAMAAVVNMANADLAQQDSADFAWKYEMTVDPTTQDLDSNGTPDFVVWSLNGGSASLAGGVLTMNYPAPNNYYAVLGPANIWPNSGVNFASGYTIEARVKIDSSTGSVGAFMMDAAPGDNMPATAELSVAGAGEFWGQPASSGANPPGVSLGSEDNTDGFHTFRIAQVPGAATYSVWRDGVLLSNSLPTAYDANGNVLLDFGAPSGVIHGSSEVDYYRFTPGAFAPVVPEPGTLTLLATAMSGLLAYAWRKRR